MHHRRYRPLSTIAFCSGALLSALLLLLASSSGITTVSGWQTGSRVSSFAGRVLVTPVDVGAKNDNANSVITMKKGKSNVPPAMRSQYKRQMEMNQMQQEMIAATKTGTDGLPVFNLFVRTKRANVRETRYMLFCLFICCCCCLCFIPRANAPMHTPLFRSSPLTSIFLETTNKPLHITNPH